MSKSNSMKTSKSIGSISRAWMRKLWGFYDDQNPPMVIPPLNNLKGGTEKKPKCKCGKVH